MKNKEPARIYQIKITIDNIHPPVWRRVLVSDKITLLELHDVIQGVFGWLNYHLHEFTINNVNYGDPANDELGNRYIQDEMMVRLRTLNLKVGSRLIYVYDFGDGWGHTLVVEKIMELEKGLKLPQCVAGKRACPPEDVGGPWGYEGFLEALRNPQHEDHETYLEWSGGEFDPNAFDLNAANERLSWRTKRGWSGSTLPAAGEGETDYKKYFAPSRWANLLKNEYEMAAKAIALRQDVITFLNYLKVNKVTGTQSTGNLPRKAVEGIAGRFVNPPELETKAGDIVFRFHSEVEIWPVYFVHTLAEGAGLIDGGPGRRWCLTDAGENFPTLPAIAQVWILFAAWWYRINWLIAYPVDIFGNMLPDHFLRALTARLLEIPIGKQIPFEPFADQLIQIIHWTWPTQETEYSQGYQRMAIERMVIDPLESFGLLTTQHERDSGRSYPYQKLISLSTTGLGKALLHTT